MDLLNPLRRGRGGAFIALAGCVTLVEYRRKRP